MYFEGLCVSPYRPSTYPRRMKIFALLIAVTIVSTSMAAAQANERIPVLIVDGFSNHDWEQTTAVTKWILESSGLFTVDVTTIPTDSTARQAWTLNAEPYAAIVQNSNNLTAEHLTWPEHAERELESYVRGGGGLYILHSANNAFLHWEAYEEMIGLGWRPLDAGYALEVTEDGEIVRIPPGEGGRTHHGDRFDAVIRKLNNHPINQDYPDRWMTANTEVYSYPRGAAKNIEVLSYALDESDTERLWPTEWVVSYGDGRVYNASLGHLWHDETYPEAYRCIGFQTTLIRAVEWAATGAVTYPVPDDFPTQDATSLRPYEELPIELR